MSSDGVFAYTLHDEEIGIDEDGELVRSAVGVTFSHHWGRFALESSCWYAVLSGRVRHIADARLVLLYV